MPLPLWADFRQVLVATVLATDMARHFSWIAKMRSLIKRFVEYEGSKEPNQDQDNEDRTMLCQALIKCADISNPVGPLFCCLCWIRALMITILQISPDPSARDFEALVERPPQRVDRASRP